MNNNNSQRNLFFLIFSSIILCFNAPVTHGETQTAREIQESEEFENLVVRNVQNNDRNGFGELLKFINSLNDTLTSLNAKLATQDIALYAQNTKIEEGFIALNTKVDKIMRKADLLLSIALNTWEDFDSLIRAQAKVMKTGKSFNGSTLSDIKSRAAQVGYQGWHTAVVFVNHLDEAIGDFTIYEEYKCTYNPAPYSVAGRTQDVFTFAPHTYSAAAHASFSYEIPSFDIRVAAISYGGTYGVGLAFVSKGANMKTYYDSRKGIEGSTVWEEGVHKDRNLSVGYKNLYARVFADYEENYKSTLRIELIQLPLDD